MVILLIMIDNFDVTFFAKKDTVVLSESLEFIKRRFSRCFVYGSIEFGRLHNNVDIKRISDSVPDTKPEENQRE